MKNFQNDSENFQIQDIRPYCPEVSTVYDFHFYNQNYKNISNEKHMLERQMNLVSILMEKEKKELLEDEFVDDKFIIDAYWSFAFEKNMTVLLNFFMMKQITVKESHPIWDI